MSFRDLVIQRQLIPPGQRSGMLIRPRVVDLLMGALEYPLTIVQAATGYGKSTELARLSEKVPKLFWFTIGRTDRDPQIFLANLFSSFNQGEYRYGEKALDVLDESQGRAHSAAITQFINNLTHCLKEDAVVVLDDYHLVQGYLEIRNLVEQLVTYCPPNLHIVLSTRQMPQFESLSKWRVKGQLLVISRKELAFTSEEIGSLFRDFYHYPVKDDEIRKLFNETEGWVIALQMIWHSLQSGAASNIAAALKDRPSTLEALFDYLARDVLAQQSEDIQQFLLESSVLTEMDVASCNAVLGKVQSLSVLEWLQSSGLFVVSIGENVFRYQHLFHDFLQQRLMNNKKTARKLHLKAAKYFEKEYPEKSIYHLMQAEQFDQAAIQLERIGESLVRMGRFKSLLGMIEDLPEHERNKHPVLFLLKGDIQRLNSDFDRALDCYTLAEHYYSEMEDVLGKSRALKGQAQVYLDTVRPLRADSLLEEALRLLEPQEFHDDTSELLDLMAENKLNLGYPDEAQSLHHEARLLCGDDDPGDIYLEARSLLRTGFLRKGRSLLEARVEEEQKEWEKPRPQRFHRETMLLLSLICAMQGDVEKTEYYAREGIAIGKRLDSAFVEAVGMIRLGHAFELQDHIPWGVGKLEAAINCYEEAIAKVSAFKVTRVQVEPLWGLSRAYGYAGQLERSEEYAQRAMEIALRAGDKWLNFLARLSYAVSLAKTGQSIKAFEHLLACREGFQLVGDSFGEAATILWLALNSWWAGETDRAMAYLQELLPIAKSEGYDALFIRQTYLGLKDDKVALPMLIEARSQGMEPEYIDKLLHLKGLAGINYHPGNTLSVRTLGLFEVWRGDIQVGANEWRREKARQLFQLLLTRRGEWLQREQIVDLLWPELDGDAAIRDFKVALNSLNRALEPARPRHAPSFFITRQENLYAVNPMADIQLDVDHFEKLCSSDDVDELKQALDLYSGDYLPDSLFEDWSMSTRSRLHRMYLETAERLASILLESGKIEEQLEVCELILYRDQYWEGAYRLMMQGYANKHNRSQMLHTYKRCEIALRDGLGMEPSKETRALYEKLLGRL